MVPKKELIRIVRSPEGDVSIDETGKKSGRGAYLSRNADIIKKARKNNILSKHLNTDIDEEIMINCWKW